MQSKATKILVLGVILSLNSSLSAARIEYQRDNASALIAIFEARGTCDADSGALFPGKRWSVFKLAGETSYEGPDDSGRTLLDRSIAAWEAALCRTAEGSVNRLLRQ
ncbi:MAG: hypothetical protein ACI9W6_002027 [Motiliproteus sp.]|jgi:hypothetical protein